MITTIARRMSLLGGIAAMLSLKVRPAPAQGDVIQSQDTNFGGIVGEITQVKRKDGVLTIKLRLRNASGQDANLKLINSSDYDSYYVTAGDKKYFVLRDTENVPLAPQASGDMWVEIAKDGTYTWWAKYPAPPAEVTSVTYYTPISAPFEDLPVTD